MRIQLFLGCSGIEGGDNGEGVRTNFKGLLAQRNGLFGCDAAGSGVDRDPVICLLHNDLQHPLFLSGGESIAFSVCAKGKQAVNAGINQPVDLIAQLLFIDALVFIHRGQNGADDTFDCDAVHGGASCYKIS